MNEKPNTPGMWKLYKMGGITPAIAAAFGNQNAQQMAFIRSMMKEQRQSSLLNIPLYEMEGVIFDLETTGFMPAVDEIISVGAVWIQGGEIVPDRSFYTLVKPLRPIPEAIQQLTGIGNEDVRQAPPLIEVLQQFLQFVEQRILIAHGSGHDKQFLNAALWKTSRVRLTHTVLDTMMVGKWLKPELGSYGLDALLDAYGIPIGRRHHALEDSRMTAVLWQHYLSEMKQRQVHLLGDLYAYLSR
ncbi:exonuclease domain-containing protein [Marinicrinis sediminis]|uniref:Exonuclease domain-containing protein n=1 Tax=Marinicrinis sediminis TaxID=1652465 RepID=A0ABW5R9W8_9BACL